MPLGCAFEDKLFALLWILWISTDIWPISPLSTLIHWYSPLISPSSKKPLLKHPEMMPSNLWLMRPLSLKDLLVVKWSGATNYRELDFYPPEKLLLWQQFCLIWAWKRQRIDLVTLKERTRILTDSIVWTVAPNFPSHNWGP